VGDRLRFSRSAARRGHGAAEASSGWVAVGRTPKTLNGQYRSHERLVHGGVLSPPARVRDDSASIWMTPYAGCMWYGHVSRGRARPVGLDALAVDGTLSMAVLEVTKFPQLYEQLSRAAGP
jgi:hypothetical protein